jgi:RecA/RadA recombinase
MTVKIVGNVPKLQRVVFDMWSFDLAFSNRNGDLGFPIGIAAEISGASSVGKSTTTYGIAGIIGKEIGKNIALADFEGFDPIFLTTVLENVGFDGEVDYIQEKDDETTLDVLLASIREKKSKYGISILDSVGAISPLAEAEGDLGEANMGRRARLMAQFSRKAIKILRDEKFGKCVFLINHQHPIMGARGVNTPGGETIKYLCAARVRMSRKEAFPDYSYVIEGKVTKNRFGYKDTVFHIVNLSGKGIHRGLTWMYDGFLNKTIERDRGRVKINGESICTLKEAFIQAHAGNNDFFLPFRDAVYKVSASPEELVEQEEEVDGDTEEADESSDSV